MAKFFENSVVKSLIVAVTYFLLTALISSVLYLTIGLYLVSNNFVDAKSIIFLDAVVYLFCFVFFYFIYFKNKRDIITNTSGNTLKRFFLVLLMVLLYRVAIDPLLRINMLVSGNSTAQEMGYDILTVNTLIKFLTVVLIVPVLEEIIFRRLIFSFLKNKRGFYFALVFSSLLFSLTHLNFQGVDYKLLANSFLIGLILAIIYNRFGLIYSFAFHIGFNLLVFLVNNFDIGYWGVLKALNFSLYYWLLISFSALTLLIALKKNT